jgi:hypothetical protein
MSAEIRLPPPAPSSPKTRTTEGELTNLILTVGGAVYALLCMPAINERGYPPIDPIWHVFPFLWVMPLILSGVIDRRPKKERAFAIGVYALATAFFDAGTLTGVVPKQVNLFVMGLETIVVFGPVHLLLTFVLEGILQLFNRRWRRMPLAEGAALRVSPRRWVVFGVLAISTIGAPFGIRQALLLEMRHRARTRADEAWSNHQAIVYGGPHTEILGTEFMVDWMYDRATGLRFRPKMYDHGFPDDYNERISELVDKNGVPEWSLAKFLISDEDLCGLLNSDKFPEICTFPFQASTGITLKRSRTPEASGEPAFDNLSVETKQSGTTGIGGNAAHVFAGRIPRFPKLVFVRCGNESIGAFHEDGYFLALASRIPGR